MEKKITMKAEEEELKLVAMDFEKNETTCKFTNSANDIIMNTIDRTYYKRGQPRGTGLAPGRIDLFLHAASFAYEYTEEMYKEDFAKSKHLTGLAEIRTLTLTPVATALSNQPGDEKREG